MVEGDSRHSVIEVSSPLTVVSDGSGWDTHNFYLDLNNGNPVLNHE
jgi:hypothetical protein